MFHFSRIGATVAGLCAGALGLSTLASAASPTVKLEAGYAYQHTPGGEFLADANNFITPPVNLPGATTNQFQTFCFQSQVDISVSVVYDAMFAPFTPPGGPTLNEQTAFLYNQFITGALTGLGGVPLYRYNNANNLRIADASALQFAIWQLEGETTLGTNVEPALTTAYINYANANAVATNFYGVQVIELNSQTSGANVQALLVKLNDAPTPGAGATLALGGLLAARRRRTVQA